jgi:hypothetical protein
MLAKLEPVLAWLTKSSASELYERVAHEYRLHYSRPGYSFPAHEWQKAKAAHEQYLARFAEYVADGEVINKTFRALLKGSAARVLPTQSNRIAEDDELPF